MKKISVSVVAFLCLTFFSGMSFGQGKEILRTLPEASQNTFQMIGVPSGYYTCDYFPEGYSLSYFLENKLWLPEGYKLNVFDCSEMSAYVEWALEDAGFNAWIAKGRCPWDPFNRNCYHAWVIALDPQTNQWTPVESTALLKMGDSLWEQLKYIFGRTPPIIIKPTDPLYSGYWKYNYIWPSIYDIPDSQTDQFDWWNVVNFIPVSDLPDLVAGHLYSPGSIMTEGTDSWVEVEVHNKGLCQAPESHVSLYISTDGDLDVSNDYYIDTKPVNLLRPDETEKVRFDFAVPYLGEGSHQVWFVVNVDSWGEVQEDNEKNTFIYKGFQIEQDTTSSNASPVLDPQYSNGTGSLDPTANQITMPIAQKGSITIAPALNVPVADQGKEVNLYAGVVVGDTLYMAENNLFFVNWVPYYGGPIPSLGTAALGTTQTFNLGSPSNISLAWWGFDTCDIYYGYATQSDFSDFVGTSYELIFK